MVCLSIQIFKRLSSTNLTWSILEYFVPFVSSKFFGAEQITDDCQWFSIIRLWFHSLTENHCRIRQRYKVAYSQAFLKGNLKPLREKYEYLDIFRECFALHGFLVGRKRRWHFSLYAVKLRTKIVIFSYFCQTFCNFNQYVKYRKYAFNIENPRNGKTSSPDLKNIPRMQK